MAHAVTYAALAAASIAAAGIGVHMGRSAISEINPIYFQDLSSTRFFSDLSPAAPRSVAWSSEVPADYWANDLNVSGRSYCMACPANFVESGSVEVATPVASESYADEAAATAPPEAVTRYADFPITREEAVENDDALPGEPAGAVAAADERDAPVGM